jgi:IS30 family transposase
MNRSSGSARSVDRALVVQARQGGDVVRVVCAECRTSRASLRAGGGIAGGLSAKFNVRGIAGRPGRSPSTISREIRRNSDPDGRYRLHHAEHAARVRAGKPRTRRLAVNVVLAEVVAGLLAKRWSPEQVARELRGVVQSARAVAVCGVDLPGDL